MHTHQSLTSLSFNGIVTATRTRTQGIPHMSKRHFYNHAKKRLFVWFLLRKKKSIISVHNVRYHYGGSFDLQKELFRDCEELKWEVGEGRKVLKNTLQVHADIWTLANFSKIKTEDIILFKGIEMKIISSLPFSKKAHQWSGVCIHKQLPWFGREFVTPNIITRIQHVKAHKIDFLFSS